MEATKNRLTAAAHRPGQMMADFLTLTAVSVVVGIVTAVAVGGVVLLLSPAGI